MTTQTYSDTKQSIVQDMRSIREQISQEIKDMSFQQERAYLDKLLSDSISTNAEQVLPTWQTDKE